MMKASILFVSLALASPALADALDGTWKVDVASAKFPERPSVYLLNGGVYTCSSCKPVIVVKADGAFHKVSGYPYMDEMAIKVVDGQTVEESDKLKGKLASVSTIKVSTDGRTVSAHWIDYTAPDGKPTSGDSAMVRLKAGPAGAHAISGEWRVEKAENISDAALILTLKLDGDVVKMSTPNGYGYEAKLDGGKAPMVGDPAGTQVTVRKLADGALEETDWRDGQAVSIMTFVPSADGRTANVRVDDKKYGTTTTYAVIKQ